MSMYNRFGTMHRARGRSPEPEAEPLLAPRAGARKAPPPPPPPLTAALSGVDLAVAQFLQEFNRLGDRHGENLRET